MLEYKDTTYNGPNLSIKYLQWRKVDDKCIYLLEEYEIQVSDFFAYYDN